MGLKSEARRPREPNLSRVKENQDNAQKLDVQGSANKECRSEEFHRDRTKSQDREISIYVLEGNIRREILKARARKILYQTGTVILQNWFDNKKSTETN